MARLRATSEQVTTWVGCPVCRLLFATTVIEEFDGGHAALLVVIEEQITVARRR